MEYTEEEIEIIKKYYPTKGSGFIFDIIGNNHTLRSIKTKAKRLGIKNLGWNKWTAEEEELFKIAWPNYSMDKLMQSFPNRTYESLMNHARIVGLKSNCNRHSDSDISFLLYENLNKESAYWWGFIMADGHLTKSGQLVITLKDVDDKHLDKLAKHLNRKLNYNQPGFVVLTIRSKSLKKWAELLKMKETAKTYFPPDLKVFEKYFPYFFIGFVDGDGCIIQDKRSQNSFNIQIEVHSSWMDNLNYFSKLLHEQLEIQSTTTISKKGYARLYITSTKNVYKLKEIAKDVEYLERKWDKIYPLNEKYNKQ